MVDALDDWPYEAELKQGEFADSRQIPRTTFGECLNGKRGLGNSGPGKPPLLAMDAAKEQFVVDVVRRLDRADNGAGMYCVLRASID